jgi:hypothetical protein
MVGSRAFFSGARAVASTLHAICAAAGGRAPVAPGASYQIKWGPSCGCRCGSSAQGLWIKSRASRAQDRIQSQRRAKEGRGAPPPSPFITNSTNACERPGHPLAPLFPPTCADSTRLAARPAPVAAGVTAPAWTHAAHAAAALAPTAPALVSTCEIQGRSGAARVRAPPMSLVHRH